MIKSIGNDCREQINWLTSKQELQSRFFLLRVFEINEYPIN